MPKIVKPETGEVTKPAPVHGRNCACIGCRAERARVAQKKKERA